MSVEIVEKVDLALYEQERSVARFQEVATVAAFLEVNDVESFNKMTALYAEAKAWEKQVEAERKRQNAPFQAEINRHNDLAKEILIPLKQIQEIAKAKTASYQELLESKKKEELAQVAQAADILGVEVPYVAPLENSIRGEGAVSYTRTVRKFRMVDLSIVPLKYLKVDEEKVERDIKLGIENISGLEIYESKETHLRTRL